MTKKLLIVFTLLFSIYTFSQNLFITKRDYSNSPTVHSLQKLNASTGTVLNNYNYTTSFTGYSPKSLTYNPQTNEIFGLSDNVITKYNILTSSEISFTLPETTSTDYGGIVIANNRLFITKRDYSDLSNYVHSLQEINQINGSLISNHILTSNIPDYNRNLSYSSLTNEIYGISGNIIYKFNIVTGIESTLTLPVLTNGEYNDVIIAENRLFVVKRDYSNNPTIHTLLELNSSNATIINTHNYTTNLVDYDKIRSLTFLADSKEICGTMGSWSLNSERIIKLSIVTNTESYFDIPIQTSNDYGEIVSTVTSDNLGVTNFENISSLGKEIKAFNLLGQEISTETCNQIIIVKYDNGFVKKIFKKM